MFCAFDLETSGLPGEAEILQLAAIRFTSDGTVIDRLEVLVAPSAQQSTRVSRLVDGGHEAAWARPVGEAVALFGDFCAGDVLVGHNALRFDRAFLAAVDPTFARRPVVDTLSAARLLMPGARHRLVDLAERLGLRHDAPHQAWSDAETTMHLFCRLVQLARSLPDQERLDLRRAALTSPSVRAFVDVVDDASRHPLTQRGGRTTLRRRPVPVRVPAARTADGHVGMVHRALVSDYDDTLVSGDHLDADTVASLRRLRASGRRAILNTGRTLASVLGDRGLAGPDNALLFDRIVAENGAVIHDPRTAETRLLATPPDARLLQRLLAQGIPATPGQASLMVPTGCGAQADAAVADMGLLLHVIRGTHYDMYLDPAVDKASGMRTALAELGLEPADAVTVGNGLNDIAMLDRGHSGAGVSVAVANAVPTAKAAADGVVRGAAAAGVRQLIDAMVRHDLRRGLPPHRQAERGIISGLAS